MKPLVIHHSADYDGIFCREIAKKFLPDAELIGWDFSDTPLVIPNGRPIYVLDLPVDRVFGFKYTPENVTQNPPQHPAGLVWIDHHKSAIETHPAAIRGYRIDGVAACRLAWQWFTVIQEADAPAPPLGLRRGLPQKQDFIDRTIPEPLAVRLAGEYDIWDKRDPRAEVFQFGLRSEEITKETWGELLSGDSGFADATPVQRLLDQGGMLQSYQQKLDADLVTYRSYRINWEGLNFIVLNTGRFNSLTFGALDKRETGHDALLGFMFNGKAWIVSLYHANHRKDLDLSKIAVKYGGGGHKGACGFTAGTLPDAFFNIDTHH